MKNNFEILRTTRNNILNVIKELSLDQLNKVPTNYSNNIIWNVGHNIVTQQILIYKLSDVETRISIEMVEKYKKGTKVSSEISLSEIENIKNLLIQTVNWLEEDYNLGVFESYTEYTTSYNITLKSTEEAIAFNNVHEGLHLGYIMAMKKLV